MSGISIPGGIKALPAGVVLDYAGATAPAGSLLCYGQNVSRATYAALFTAIGTAWGAGDGSTTFGLPDLRGRATFGKDDMGGAAASRVTVGVSGIAGATLGGVGGDQRMDAHDHSVNLRVGAVPADQNTPGYPAGQDAGGNASFHNSFDTDTRLWVNDEGAGASQNMPPAAVVNKIITTGGV